MEIGLHVAERIGEPRIVEPSARELAVDLKRIAHLGGRIVVNAKADAHLAAQWGERSQFLAESGRQRIAQLWRHIEPGEYAGNIGPLVIRPQPTGKLDALKMIAIHRPMHFRGPVVRRPCIRDRLEFDIDAAQR